VRNALISLILDSEGCSKNYQLAVLVQERCLGTLEDCLD